MSDDKLIVQVAITVKVPGSVRITKKVLNELIQRMVEGKPIPPNVEVRGIFWRNPNRTGNLAAWRYHDGADLSAAPDGPIESRSRGSLQDALTTLAPFLETGRITF